VRRERARSFGGGGIVQSFLTLQVFLFLLTFLALSFSFLFLSYLQVAFSAVLVVRKKNRETEQKWKEHHSMALFFLDWLILFLHFVDL